MGLLAKIIQNEAKKFLKIDQAILIVKHLFRESYRTTWIYLSQNHVFDDLEVYEKGKNLSFNIIDKGDTFVEADDYALSGRVDTTGYFSDSIHEKYWKKSDFLELESIRKIGITYEIIDHYLNYHYIKAGHDSFTPFKDIPPPNFDELPTQEPIGCGNPTIQQNEPNIESLNAEISRLRKEIEDRDKTAIELQNRINELEGQLSDALSKNIPSINDELHPSLDPTHKNHAPELLLAVQAWEAKYQKNDYPHQEHTPAITNILKNKNVTQVNLVKRICAITNPKK